MRALIIVDVLNDFMPEHGLTFTPRPTYDSWIQGRWFRAGALPVPDGHLIVPGINEAMRDFEISILLQDWHPKNHCSFPKYGIHCLQNTFGADFYPGLDTARARMIQRKGMRIDTDSFSGLKEDVDPQGIRRLTGLDGALRALAVTETYSVGLAKGQCVLWTATDAAELGFKSYVFRDLTKALDPSLDAQIEEEGRAKGVNWI